MTAQASERLIVDGRPRQLFADPLYRLRTHCRLKLGSPFVTSSNNWRGYVGTWEIRDDRLYLMHLCWNGWSEEHQVCEEPISDELRRKLLRAASASSFPIHAHWFNGVLRIAIGRRLVYSHHGWSHWHERTRLIHFRAGTLVRDREVDTRAILEWWLRRNPEEIENPAPGHPAALGPLTWFVEDEDDDDWTADWWPPDYERGH